jgi:DNA polymerase
MNITNEMKKEIVSILKMKKLLGIEHFNQIDFSPRKKEIAVLPNDLKSLEEYVYNCSLCELYKSKVTNIFGKGTPSNEIYIVGLNYNFESEKEFLMIKNMCEKVLDRNINDIYMTNIIKCHTNKMKTDIENEIMTCIHYIEQQINISKPKVIITLGRAFEYLMKSDDDIMDAAGNSFNYNGLLLMPLMDPLFINKNPSYKEKMFKDLQKIKTILDEK